MESPRVSHRSTATYKFVEIQISALIPIIKRGPRHPWTISFSEKQAIPISALYSNQAIRIPCRANADLCKAIRQP
ncbi:hypothetical protein CEXT_507831 [Caerostris extrusa]|uniref:Uncharacterized protein n=1 Tax=Caerostris extrusa TaxID=172846 RepID=A0AAV4XDU9_CAEEX|nr:hypothetical protein CEXT_507831 [Caerostris extrusa]